MNKPFEPGSNTSSNKVKTIDKYILEVTNTVTSKIYYRVLIRGRYSMNKTCSTLKEAKLAIDKFLISKGLEPIHILKKKDESKN